MTRITTATPTTQTATPADLLRDMAFVLKLAQSTANAIRREHAPVRVKSTRRAMAVCA